MSTIFFDRPLTAPLQALQQELPQVPLVSIVMTCYNTAPWLQAAVTSALDQRGWDKLELVVVNDASTDESARILSRLAASDPRLRTFHLPERLGTYRAKNIGMSIARGDLITFMDSDDIILPDRVASQATLLLSRELVATTCNYRRVNSAGDTIPMGGLTERQALISLMFRRRVIADIGWFDAVKTSADDEFFERIRFVYGRDSHENVSKAMYLALNRPGSLSAGTTPVHLGPTRPGSRLSAPRQAYVESYRRWYQELTERGRRPYIPFNILTPRAFPAPSQISFQT